MTESYFAISAGNFLMGITTYHRESLEIMSAGATLGYDKLSRFHVSAKEFTAWSNGANFDVNSYFDHNTGKTVRYLVAG